CYFFDSYRTRIVRPSLPNIRQHTGDVIIGQAKIRHHAIISRPLDLYRAHQTIHNYPDEPLFAPLYPAGTVKRRNRTRQTLAVLLVAGRALRINRLPGSDNGIDLLGGCRIFRPGKSATAFIEAQLVKIVRPRHHINAGENDQKTEKKDEKDRDGRKPLARTFFIMHQLIVHALDVAIRSPRGLDRVPTSAWSDSF